ncbi:MAG: preprotein translocase subunit SecG [Bacteroidaceae bacterium]|nr:preprotein translocase subunit SecG [Bacteroidaceae bacterium]
MYLLSIILIVLAAVLMCFIVLIQNSKGGGLASGFASSNQIMGVRKTTDFLEKATWSLAGFIVVMSIIATRFVPETISAEHSRLQTEMQANPMTAPDFTQDVQEVAPVEAPAAPAETPAN